MGIQILHASFSFLLFTIIFSPGSVNVEAKLYLVNATSDQRLQVCGIADSLLNKNSTNLSGINIDSLRITNLGKVFCNTLKSTISSKPG